MSVFRKLRAEPLLTLSAICLGAFVAVADRVLFGAILGRPASFSELDVLVINALLAAAPFLVLAYRSSTRLLPWLTGIVLTFWLWWRWLENGVAYQRAPDGSGVPMGFALFMLVSPIFIALLCAWLDEVLRQFRLIRVEASNGRPSSLLSAVRFAPIRATLKWKRLVGEMWRQFSDLRLVSLSTHCGHRLVFRKSCPTALDL